MCLIDRYHREQQLFGSGRYKFCATRQTARVKARKDEPTVIVRSADFCASIGFTAQTTWFEEHRMILAIE